MTRNYATSKRSIDGITLLGDCARIGLLLMIVLVLCGPVLAQKPATEFTTRQSRPKPRDIPYETLYYKSGNLKIEAYLYKPAGDGPFPLVIYNHGSRAGQEHTEIPFRFIAAILVPQGYAVLVPERRGYGKSDGSTFGEEVGSDIGELMMRRFHEEAADMLAGLDYLKKGGASASSDLVRPTAQPNVIDFGRVALVGWSHGGVVSILAASEKHEFVALVDQAAGALTWNRSHTLQTELPAAARKIKIPALCLDAENDATTNAVKTVGEAIRSSGEWEKTIIYPAFTPTSNPSNIAPGHLIFAQGVSIWQDDLLQFLKPHLEQSKRFEGPRAVEPVKPVKP